MADVDDLFTLKNHFFIGNFQVCPMHSLLCHGKSLASATSRLSRLSLGASAAPEAPSEHEETAVGGIFFVFFRSLLSPQLSSWCCAQSHALHFVKDCIHTCDVEGVATATATSSRLHDGSLYFWAGPALDC